MRGQETFKDVLILHQLSMELWSWLTPPLKCRLSMLFVFYTPHLRVQWRVAFSNQNTGPHWRANEPTWQLQEGVYHAWKLFFQEENMGSDAENGQLVNHALCMCT